MIEGEKFLGHGNLSVDLIQMGKQVMIEVHADDFWAALTLLNEDQAVRMRDWLTAYCKELCLD